jgi:excisionase family DNA binding protein
MNPFTVPVRDIEKNPSQPWKAMASWANWISRRFTSIARSDRHPGRGRWDSRIVDGTPWRGDMQMNKHIVELPTSTTEVKVLCNVQDVASMLSIGRTAAWELVRKHKIKSVKIGRTRRVPIAAIEEYIKQLLDEEVA